MNTDIYILTSSRKLKMKTMKIENCLGKFTKDVEFISFYGLNLQIEKTVGDQEDGFHRGFKIISCEVKEKEEFEDFMDFNSIDYSPYDLTIEKDVIEIVMNNFYNLVFENVFHGYCLLSSK